VEELLLMEEGIEHAEDGLPPSALSTTLFFPIVLLLKFSQFLSWRDSFGLAW